MKIVEGTGLLIPESQKKQPKTASGDGDFRKIMDRVRGRNGQEPKPAGIDSAPSLPPGGIQMTAPTVGTINPKTVEAARETAAALENTLVLLDFYAAKLGDTTLKSSDLNPMIDHLEDRLLSLEEMNTSTRLPESLKTLLKETMMVMGTEIAKFRRGDYT